MFRERWIDQPPKLVLLDLKLPKIDGIEVLKLIKGDPRTWLIPVVVMTSSREERDLARCYDLGANSYIQKPVDFEQFQKTVSTAARYWTVINQRPALTETDQLAGPGGS